MGVETGLMWSTGVCFQTESHMMGHMTHLQVHRSVIYLSEASDYLLIMNGCKYSQILGTNDQKSMVI